MTHPAGNWPLNIDFTAAIHNPSSSLDDGDLMLCQSKKDKRGLTKPSSSGNFAIVYELINGQRHWAVRCFLKQPVSDRQKRYAAISKYLNSHTLSYFVEFKFIEKGIRVNGQWYPILKMDWVQGITLDCYINKNIGNTAFIQTLLQQVRQLQQDLRNVKIAHGDLQHGNILVTQSGQLKLVDYDGMYVPELQGNPPGEFGHPNYQLPTRSSQDFNVTVDDFSFDVVVLSLAAIIEEPFIWFKFHNEKDESLIFKKKDFEDPDNSDVFKYVSQIKDSGVKALCTQLVNRCKGISPGNKKPWYLNREKPPSSSDKPWWVNRLQAITIQSTPTNNIGVVGAAGTIGVVVALFLSPFNPIKFPYQVSAFLPSPSPRSTYSFNFPMTQGCGDSNPRPGETWYPVFIKNSSGMLERVSSKYCPNDKPEPNEKRKYGKSKSTSIQVASFRDRKKAEAFAEHMRKEVGSGEVGESSPLK